MPDRDLSRLLKDLDRELEGNPDLDDDERIALAGLKGRLEGILEARRADEAEDDSPIEPLRTYVDRFETTHPTLTMILGRIADALNKMGI